ncbi:MAG: Na/Pi cotransporter family protein [Ruminococcaceae bacterium]|nr:Na/Pi cotransporter family protein [Oscillospiraceae bacterium]
MGFMDVLTMFGGLVVFLYGMDMMGAGLRKVSGGKLEKLLEKMTGRTLRGVLLGAGVTAIIQSSSATTVMVVGFVNSGIMTLKQAIGVIMGANVGTTVTAWLLSLSGLQGDSLLVSIFKPESIAAVCGVIGIGMTMFCKSDSKKDIGGILAAFCALLFGMDVMSGAVKPLANDPTFTSLFTMFTNPFLGLLAGIVLTAIIQSSSASVGILQALTVTGSITYGAAIPIILGQNIGTCATALISCSGANRGAKRAAMVHLYFNIIGAVVFLLLFLGMRYILNPPFLANALDAANIAVIHTAFNIISTVVILPFTRQLEKLAYLTIPEPDEKVRAPKALAEYETAELDPRFLSTPGIALERCRSVGSAMASLSRSILLDSLDLFNKWDEDTAARIIKGEDDADILEDKLGAYLVTLSGRSLTNEDSAEASQLLHAIGDWERISDHAKQILSTVEEMREKNVSFSEAARAELDVMFNAVRETLTLTVHAFSSGDRDAARQVEPLIQVSEGIKQTLRSRHIARLQEGACTIELGFIFSDLLTSLERVGAHCSNIALNILETDPHAYVDHLKKEDESYEQMVTEYSTRYQLPAAK